MMLKLIKYTSILIVLQFVNCSYFDKQYIQRRTGITFPPGIDNIYIVEDPSMLMSYWIMIHFSLPEESKEAFIEKYKLIPVLKPGKLSQARDLKTLNKVMDEQRIHSSSKSFKDLWLIKLPERYQKIDKNHDLYYKNKNFSDGTNWELLLNKNSRSVWIVVTYPD